jgi:hypothetical protein
MDRSVTLDPAERAKCAGPDDHPKMAFTRPVVAGVALVAMAFIDHLKSRWRERLLQAHFYLVCDAHFVCQPLQPDAKDSKLTDPSRKGVMDARAAPF